MKTIILNMMRYGLVLPETVKGPGCMLFGLTGHRPNQKNLEKKKETRGRKPKYHWPESYADVEKKINRWRKVRVRKWADFSREDLVKETGIPRYIIQNYFQIYINKDFREWKTEVKVDATKNLLIKYPEKSIYEIGKMGGFSDNANFHRQFKRITGTTPQSWREQFAEGR